MSTDLKLQRLHSEIKISLKIDKAVSFFFFFHAVMQVTDESGQFYAMLHFRRQRRVFFFLAPFGSVDSHGSFFNFASPGIVYSLRAGGAEITPFLFKNEQQGPTSPMVY